MSNHLKHIVLLGILLWLSSSMMMVGTQVGVNTDATSTFTVAETDLNRAEWTMDHFSNPGFEEWTTAHEISDIDTTQSTEHYGWYAENPWPVSDLSRSRGFQSRAIDPEHPGTAYLSRSDGWIHWNNPTNLTMKFDWYIDSMPQPIDYDYFKFTVNLGVPSDAQMHYYFNCEESGHTNTSNYMWFFIEGPAQTWNTFDRNITEDYFELWGVYPTQFQQFRFEQLTRSSDYSRAFIDDFQMVNGTTVYFDGSIYNGNFESNSIWTSGTNSEAADISQSSVSQEGDWSLNAKTKSNGNQSELSFSYSPDRRLSPLNPDTFSFQWRMDEFDGANEDTFAYVSVSGSNESESFDVYYVLAYGDNTNSFTYQDTLIINVTDFNTTGQWNTFSRSIWSDMSSFYQLDYIVLNDIEINIKADGPTSAITILFDDMRFQSAALDDMGYEDQGDVGDEVLSWGAYSGSQPEFTVTDTSYSGVKAANLTVADGNTWGESVRFDNRFINDNTDLWLDFFWRIEDDSADEENLMYLEVYFESGEVLAYIFANHSAVPTGNGFDEYIILPEVNTEGVWINFQRNLFDDFATIFGSAPDTEINWLDLFAEADLGGRFEVLFDDVYLYNDPAPEISVIYMTSPIANQEVNVSASVSDLSDFSVALYYQVGNGTWNDVTMVASGDGFNATIPGQTWGTQVNFYVEATDEFGQVLESTHLTYLIPSEPDPTQPPNYLPLIVGVGVAVVIVGVVIVYYFIIKPKQGAE